jgi:Zn-dependent peptidase ImmA (M78 family)/transcriptional regulator with XRE-family HTH domain
VPSGKRIRQARELAGLTQSALAEKVAVSQGLIAQIESSFKIASSELVQRIATQTQNFQAGFFFVDPPIEFPPEAVMFRAMASMTRTEETEARRYAEVVCEFASALLGHIKPIKFNLELVPSTNPIEAAQRVRSHLGIPIDQPISHLIREVEKSGVLVLALPMDLPKRDALSFRANAIDMPVIALSSGRPGDRVRLTVAHELGHIVLRHARVLNSLSEKQAYEFGAELLLPESAMRREMTAPVTLSLLATLKARWRVSIQALTRRGKDLGILDESRYRYLYTQLSVKGWRKNEPVEIPVERPRLLRQLVERIYGEDCVPLANALGFRTEFVRGILLQYDRAKPKEQHPFTSKVVAFRR